MLYLVHALDQSIESSVTRSESIESLLLELLFQYAVMHLLASSTVFLLKRRFTVRWYQIACKLGKGFWDPDKNTIRN